MTSRWTLRKGTKWAGWICLLLAFLPYYWREAIPGHPVPQELPEEVPDMPYFGSAALPKESTATKFSVGLPFSPWFRYVKEVVYTRVEGPAFSFGITSTRGSSSLIGRRPWRRWALSSWSSHATFACGPWTRPVEHLVRCPRTGSGRAPPPTQRRHDLRPNQSLHLTGPALRRFVVYWLSSRPGR